MMDLGDVGISGMEECDGLEENGGQEFNVEELLAYRRGKDIPQDFPVFKRRDDAFYYLVKWDGFPLEECTWEPSGNIPPELRDEYAEKRNREEAEEINIDIVLKAVRTAKHAREEEAGVLNIAHRIHGDAGEARPNEAPWDDLLKVEGSKDPGLITGAVVKSRRPALKQTTFTGIMLTANETSPGVSSAKQFGAARSSENGAQKHSRLEAPQRPGKDTTFPRYPGTGYQGTRRGGASAIPIIGAAPKTPTSLSQTANLPSQQNRARAPGIVYTARRSRQLPPNIFKDGLQKKRRSNLEDTMSDITRDLRLFPTLRQQNQAAKKSRSREDQAPDVSNMQVIAVANGTSRRKSSLTAPMLQQAATLPWFEIAARDAAANQPSASVTTSTTNQARSSTPSLFLDQPSGLPPSPGRTETTGTGGVKQDISLFYTPDQRDVTEIRPQKKRKSVHFSDQALKSEPDMMDLDDESMLQAVSPPAAPGTELLLGPPPSPPATDKDILHAANTSTRQTSDSTDVPVTSAVTNATQTLTLAECKSRPSIQDVQKKLRVGEATVDVVMTDVPHHTDSFPGLAAFRGMGILELNSTCFCKNVLSQGAGLYREHLWEGSITSKGNAAALERAAEKLRTCLTGLFCACAEFCLLVYPSRCEEWNFLSGSLHSQDVPAHVSLRYQVFSPAYDIWRFLRPHNVQMDFKDASKSPAKDGPLLAADKLFGWNYAKLLPMGSKLKAHNFFLLFPDSRAHVRWAVVDWLRGCDPTCNVFLANEGGSWQDFRAHADRDPGAVLIHEVVARKLHRLPNLASYLHTKSDAYWRFTERLQPLSVYPSSMSSDEPRPPDVLQFNRLFPAGRSAYLLTPSFVVTEPEACYQFFNWFMKRAKSFSWRLVTACNIHRYLMDLAVEKAQERERLKASERVIDQELQAALRGLAAADCEFRFKTVTLATDLHEIRETSLALDLASREGESCSLIYAPSCINAHDEQSLVNWFGYWSMTQADRYRKFRVIGSSVKKEPLGSERSARTIMAPTYSRRSRNDPDVDSDTIGDPKRSVGPTTGSPATCADVELADNERDIIHTLETLDKTWEEKRKRERCSKPWLLYKFPIVTLDDDSMPVSEDRQDGRHKRLSNWLKFLHPWSRKFSNPTRSYLGLFYTVAGPWPSQHSNGKQQQSKNAWLAIYRPVNPDDCSQWEPKIETPTEVIIWDSTAGVKYPERCRGLVEDQLLGVQRRLIQYLRQDGAPQRLDRLDRVWLGGFDVPPECVSETQLDTTYQFLKKLCSPELLTHLPARPALLQKQGYRQVWTCTVEAEAAEPPEEDEADTCIIFHPPRKSGGGGQEFSRCTNSLYEEARLARRAKAGQKGPLFLNYNYRATEEWYKDLQDEGRAYEHIVVDSGKDFVKNRIAGACRASNGEFGDTKSPAA